VVLLTAEPEPYIQALLAIAGGRPVFDLAPAPVPLFLRRRHLTQRIHALLKEARMSKLRLLSTYSTMAALLAFAAWLAFVTFPLVGNAQAQSLSPAAAAPSAPVYRPEPSKVAFQTRQNPAAGRGEMSKVAPVPVPPDPGAPVGRRGILH
jgi:hypothetical protein